jgi:putative acetyltransferase
LINTVHIRHYTACDADALADIFNRAVAEIASAAYAPAEIAAWLDGGLTAEESHARCSDGRTTWVAANDRDDAIAFTDLEDDGHIDMLYCLPDWARRGVASALYRELEAAARHRGMTRLYVEASEIAKPFFARHGFTRLHRNDFVHNGVATHNYAMEKRLGPASAT